MIIATGAAPRRLGLEGEDTLTGMGVHYCAHCDGRFYKGKTVAVIGGGNSAVEDAIYLSRLAERVILVHRRDTLRASKYNQQRLSQANNLEYKWNTNLTALTAEGGRLKEIELTNTLSKKETLRVDGVFVSIGRKPETSLVDGVLSLDKNGYIIADETTRTNIPGVFAAGDVLIISHTF